MKPNKLENPSFEEGWYHGIKKEQIQGWEFYRAPVGGESGIQELQLPNAWEFSNATAVVENPYNGDDHNKFVRPEVNHKHVSQLPPIDAEDFILHGEYCLKIFKGYGTWWGVLFQTLTLVPGTYEFAVNVYADLVDHYKDGEKVAPKDPTSGQLRVVWGTDASPWILLDPLKQNEITSAITITETTTLKVGVEVMCSYAINNNGMFFDALKVERTDETPPCKNPARVSYDRTAVLLPSYMGPAEAGAAMVYAWASAKWSVLGSADDAGIGCGLNSRRIIAVDPLAWGDSGALKDFYDTYYPGAEYLEAAFEIPDINLIAPSPYTLDQIKGRILAADLMDKGIKFLYPTTHKNPYITNQFGSPGPGYDSHNGLDFRSSYRTWGDEIVAAVGGKVIRAGYYSAEPWYGWQVRVETDLPDGRIMLTRYAHFETNGLYVRVGDNVTSGQKLGKPDNTGNSTGDHLHLDVKVEGGDAPAFYADPGMLIDWSFLEKPEPPPKPAGIYPDRCRGYIGTQALGGAAMLTEYWGFRPSVFKTVLMKGELGLYKQRAPNGHAVYRHWTRDEGGYPKRPDKAAAAHEWINLFIDDLAYEMRRYGFKEVWVESVNETYNNDRLHNQNSIAFDMEFIHALAEINATRYPDLVFRPIVLTAAVGNPALPSEDPLQWEEILPLAILCVAHKGAFGYHAYWFADKAHPEYTVELAPYLQDRFKAYDAWLRRKNVFVNWIMTEGGPVGGAYDPATGSLQLFASNGWKKAYDGDWPRTKNEYLSRNQDLHNYGLKYGRRFFDTLYQSGSHDHNWLSFDVSGQNLMDLGAAIAGANLP